MRIGTPRYFPKSLQELMFNSLSTAFIIFGDVCREKYILDFEKFIFWLERGQKVEDGFYGAIVFFLLALAKRMRSSVKKRCVKVGPPFKVFITAQFLRSTSCWIRCARYSMQRMKMYDESGSPCLIPLEGGKG